MARLQVNEDTTASGRQARRLGIRPAAEPIFVTRPSLPDLAALDRLLGPVWKAAWLTNRGALHQRLESELAAYLGLPHLSLAANGTLALMLALRSVGARDGEVITTPFTFPATAHVLDWVGLKPVFADIDADTGCIDPAAVEAAVTPRTTAILAVHVYGTPCDDAALSAIASRHGLPLVYDAAHAFGVTSGGRSLLALGDASAISFHATKLFTTAEGGAVVVRDAQAKARIDQLGNFGILNEEEVGESGLNAKMSELHAALGLLQLQTVSDEIACRRVIAGIYDEALRGVEGISIVTRPDPGRTYNFYAIRVDAHAFGMTRDELHADLRGLNIITRRYFYPLLTDTAAYRDIHGAWPVASRFAEEVLCLPIYGTLEVETAGFIATAIKAIAARR